jgi:hypothetical protein
MTVKSVKTGDEWGKMNLKHILIMEYCKNSKDDFMLDTVHSLEFSLNKMFCELDLFLT